MYYSQCDEDRIVYEKYVKNLIIDNPVYLEMGAMDGLYYSNTLFFERNLGWTGILIEPHPSNFAKLLKNRPNNKLYNDIISDSTTEVDYMYYDQEHLGGVAGIVSTIPANNINVFYTRNNDWISEQIDKYLRTIKLKPTSLSEIIKHSGYNKIDFFSLDVEGHEYNVLNSFDWSVPINMFLIRK